MIKIAYVVQSLLMTVGVENKSNKTEFKYD